MHNLCKNFSDVMNDYLKQYRVLVKASEIILTRCVSIYPAANALNKGIKETVDAIKEQALHEIGVAEVIGKMSELAKVNLYWDWNKEFKEWRQQKPYRVIADGRRD